jgi:hypothetical protein
VQVGELSAFSKLYEDHVRFDFITLTNTTHEIGPSRLAIVIVDALLRLGSFGSLFIYDMEQISPPELGAVPWTREEMRAILGAVLRSLGARDYLLEVGRWKHRNCNAWNAQIQRQHLSFTDEQGWQLRKEAIESASTVIKELLHQKLAACQKSLEGLTRFGAETAQEQADKLRLLYDFWAISRAIEDSR